MLKATRLPEVLKQGNTSGVKGAILIQPDGSPLSSAGQENDSEAHQIVVTAIISNIWGLYNKENSELDYMIVDCEQGRVCATRVSKLVLCIYGDEKAQFGMLKAKAQLIREYLEGPLNEVYH
eukprot:TRINITY_DN993_c0_g1_i1.p1 TRINITY_DN993_c0_g1~~TRINITY_DN993_c0_g1_i1.p1  ORF type:complete len:122 (-),score=24.14 TRINITY_DN993_c0_g1_i1:65-430(-)